MKSDYNAFFIASLLMLGVSQTLEGLATPIGLFLHGFLVGLSIVCIVLGLILYARSPRKG